MKNVLVCLLTFLPLLAKAQSQSEPYKDRGFFLYGGFGNLSNTLGGEAFGGYHIEKWSLGIGVTAGVDRDSIGMPDFFQARLGYRINNSFLVNAGAAWVIKNADMTRNNYVTPMVSFQYHWSHFERGTFYTSTNFFAPNSNNPLYVSIVVGLTLNLVPNSDY